MTWIQVLSLFPEPRSTADITFERTGSNTGAHVKDQSLFRVKRSHSPEDRMCVGTPREIRLRT